MRTSFRSRFTAAMDDDLNTPQALAAMFDLAREINRGMEAGHAVGAAQATLRELASVLGLTLEERAGGERNDAHPFIDLLVETRDRLRAERSFQLGDSIRARLDELGVNPGGHAGWHQVAIQEPPLGHALARPVSHERCLTFESAKWSQGMKFDDIVARMGPLFERLQNSQPCHAPNYDGLPQKGHLRLL